MDAMQRLQAWYNPQSLHNYFIKWSGILSKNIFWLSRINNRSYQSITNKKECSDLISSKYFFSRTMTTLCCFNQIRQDFRTGAADLQNV